MTDTPTQKLQDKDNGRKKVLEPEYEDIVFCLFEADAKIPGWRIMLLAGIENLSIASQADLGKT